MTRHVALALALFQLFGPVPVAAFSCVESGQAGVVPYFSAASKSCYVDSCCDSDSHSPGVVATHVQTPCCDLDLQDGVANSRILQRASEHGKALPPTHAIAHVEAGHSGPRVVENLLSPSPFDPSINLPLLI